MADPTPHYAPFVSRFEQLAWRASLGGLLLTLVYVASVWE